MAMESFKIGDARRPQVSSVAQRKSGKDASAQGSQSIGFERIEKLLEQDDASEQIKALEDTVASLRQLAADAVSPREKSAAEKAIVAYEHLLELIQYLLKTKEQMATKK